MTYFEFLAECGERLIDPAIALECEAVRAALRTGDAEQVRAALDDNS